MKEIKAQMTAFDYEDEPGEEYLRLTFNIAKKDINEVLKTRFATLGADYIINATASPHTPAAPVSP